MNKKAIDSIIEYRNKYGKIVSRDELSKVKGITPKVFEQSIGFMRIIDGTNPLDKTSIHPEKYQEVEKLLEKLNLTKEDIVLDLYCGIGTIGIFASDNVKKIYGIETIKEAIDDAKENAKINGVNNSEFFVGDVEKVLPEFIKERNITADVIFIDPPRKGCDNTALETILNIEPKKIVYVSCNPASLARDLKTLEEKYKIEKLAICDMFPFTSHIETVTLLTLKNQ